MTIFKMSFCIELSLVCILDMPGGERLAEDMLEARDIVLCMPTNTVSQFLTQKGLSSVRVISNPVLYYPYCV
jgi:hypothetical protein